MRTSRLIWDDAEDDGREETDEDEFEFVEPEEFVCWDWDDWDPVMPESVMLELRLDEFTLLFWRYLFF